ncbi:hypothetical protein HMP06_1267 [Sphingomonas sp. HMP6]|nr:hypothetical protein HMP06_1267 [Sphingomonas sp. HMP6]
MHRLGAGTPDAEGWVRAQSTSGAMKADLPCRYNDFTMTVVEQSAPVIKSFGIGCKRPDGLKMSVVRAVYRAGEKSAVGSFTAVAANYGKAAKKVTRSKSNGHDVIDISSGEAGSCAESRFVRAGRDNIIMTLEAPTSDCAAFKAVGTRFFNSLEFENRSDA